MKKIFHFFVCFLPLPIFAYLPLNLSDIPNISFPLFSNSSCNITIKYPNGGEKIYRGIPFDIKWEKSGTQCSTNIKIELYYQYSLIHTISPSTENDGTFTWIVPPEILDGSYYRIKIADTINSNFYDFSDGFFSISSAPTCSIYIKSPGEGETLYKGQEYNLEWEAIGNDCAGRVGIDLYYAGHFYSTVKSSTINNGIYSWTIPADIKSGNSYRIKIFDFMKPEYFSFSKNFSIVSPYGENLFVPAVASSKGSNNTNWKTDLMVLNPLNKNICYKLIFTYNSGKDVKSFLCEARCLEGENALYYEDLIKNNCCIVENVAGNLRFEVENIPFITSRTYNDKNNGTYGQFIPSAIFDDSLSLNNPENYGYILGITENERYRTNIGFTETAGSKTTLNLTFYNSLGVEISKASVLVPAFGWLQKNWKDFGFPNTENGYLKIEILSGGAVLAYGSIIDNFTGDGIYVPLKKKLDFLNSSKQIVAVIASNEGAFGSKWRSDLWVLNTNSTEKEISLRYSSNHGNYLTNLKIKAYEQMYLKNVVKEINPNIPEDSFGSLILENSNGIIAISRTYNETENGTYGQFIPSIPEKEVLNADSFGYILNLRCDENFRSNIGFSNFTKDDLKVSLTIYRNDGQSLGTREYLIYKYQNYQINNVIESFGLQCNYPSFYAKVYIKEGSGYIYGSVIDNRTGDGIFIPPLK